MHLTTKNPAAPDRTTPTSQGDPVDIHKELRRELSRALGVSDVDSEELRRIFTEGVGTVRELEQSGKISSSTSDALLSTLATLYLDSLVSRFSERMVGPRRPMVPHFMHWLVTGPNK